MTKQVLLSALILSITSNMALSINRNHELIKQLNLEQRELREQIKQLELENRELIKKLLLIKESEKEKILPIKESKKEKNNNQKENNSLDPLIFTHLFAAGVGYFFGAAVNQPTTSDLNKHKTVYNGFNGTELDGNSLFFYLFNGSMTNPYPEFPHTKIIEFTKNQTYEDQATLEELAADQEGKVFKNFKKDIDANNFTFCRNIAQRLNRDDKLKKVHGIIIGSPDKNHCILYKKTQANCAANANTI
jgi:hypothetical protein